jgi:hypothetical protein
VHILLLEHIRATCSKTPKYICQDISRGPRAQGYPGGPSTKRARDSAPGHPGQGHVEMRGTPGPSGCGARDPNRALIGRAPRGAPTVRGLVCGPIHHIPKGLISVLVAGLGLRKADKGVASTHALQLSARGCFGIAAQCVPSSVHGLPPRPEGRCHLRGAVGIERAPRGVRGLVCRPIRHT